LKRTRIKRKSKTPIAKAKAKLWKALKKVIEIRDGDTCISCGAKGLKGHSKHGGHFIPSSSCGGFLRYDFRNVHIQCATCNLFRGGAGAEYTLVLQKKYGPKFVERIIADKQQTIKLDIQYVEQLTDFYLGLQDKTPEELIKITKRHKGFYGK